MHNKKGFSLGELLVVIVLIMLVSLVVLFSYRTQVAKAHDSTRKDHFSKFKVAFEDFYNDHNCYPTQSEWDACECDGDCMSPYLEKYFCDPVSRQKYYYLPYADDAGQADPCRGYRLYVKLENTGDPDIRTAGCGPRLGCGEGELAKYNYGISTGISVVDPDFVPDTVPATPTPSPTPIPGSNFCLGDGSKKCNIKSGCAPSYDKRPCNEVLIQEFGCRGFVDANECATLCDGDYERYKCPATETLVCKPWRVAQCQ